MLKQTFYAVIQASRIIFITLIQLYQKIISPLIGPSCRFYPSCSVYAQMAVRRFGVFRGGYCALRRLLCCHPFHPGGVDPLPEDKRTK